MTTRTTGDISIAPGAPETSHPSVQVYFVVVRTPREYSELWKPGRLCSGAACAFSTCTRGCVLGESRFTVLQFACYPKSCAYICICKCRRTFDTRETRESLVLSVKSVQRTYEAV